jgi:uncharacterized protein (TIGR02996 family)
MLVRVEDRKMTRRFVRGDWFWEVTLEATTVRKRSGKVGTGGQELVSRFDTPAEANVACQDAVAQHVKAGYLPVDGNPERDGPYLDDGTWIRLEDEAGRFREALCEGVRLLQRRGATGEPGELAVELAGTFDADGRRALLRWLEQQRDEGFRWAGMGGAVALDRNEELEQAIRADPARADAYLVYADWLEARGNPWGRWISVSHALESEEATPGLSAAKEELVDQLGWDLLPRKLSRLLELPIPEAAGWRRDQAIRRHCTASWRYGFLRAVRLSLGEEPYDLCELLMELFAHPAGRFIEELRIGSPGFEEHDYTEVVTMLAALRPASLRTLFLADFEYPDDSELSWAKLGDLEPLWGVLPQLRVLHLRGGEMQLGRIQLPTLRQLTVETGTLSKESALSIAGASWPALESLELWFGQEDYGAEATVEHIAPILAGGSAPRLRRLGLRNCELTAELCEALPEAEVLDRLESLDLSLGTMNDEEAKRLARDPRPFENLARLDVSENYLTESSRPVLSKLCHELTFGEQRDPMVYGEYERFASVGE